jgi:plastocyanin
MDSPNVHRAALAIILIALSSPMSARAASPTPSADRHFYLPSEAASKIVTAAPRGKAAREIIIVTQPVAIKENGPKETIDAFGEVYTFSPTFIAVHRDEPTLITFWNLQPDDDHDFALLAHDLSVLMYVDLPPLKKTSYVFTFHQEGLFDFKCMQHQPAMGGEFLVLPPQKAH